jgi:osmotically-inducible protein OsmY
MKSDTQLQHDVIEELEWEPSIDSSNIGVMAKDGVVTLTGSAPRYSEKMEAESLAKSIAGVRAVANDIEVRLPGASERNDTDIAIAAVNALKWHTFIPGESIKVTVRNGWVTLEGKVEWQFQRQAARDAVAYLIGVKGVTNQITLTAKPKAKDNKEKIQAAFKRNAEIDARRVSVETVNGKVKLKGNVGSWSEYSEAERVAWAAPGVTTVENDLSVGIGST